MNQAKQILEDAYKKQNEATEKLRKIYELGKELTLTNVMK